jgi:hypothetical protein
MHGIEARQPVVGTAISFAASEQPHKIDGPASAGLFLSAYVVPGQPGAIGGQRTGNSVSAGTNEHLGRTSFASPPNNRHRACGTIQDRRALEDVTAQNIAAHAARGVARRVQFGLPSDRLLRRDVGEVAPARDRGESGEAGAYARRGYGASRAPPTLT